MGFNPIYKRVVAEFTHPSKGRIIIAKGLPAKVLNTEGATCHLILILYSSSRYFVFLHYNMHLKMEALMMLLTNGKCKISRTCIL